MLFLHRNVLDCYLQTHKWVSLFYQAADKREFRQTLENPLQCSEEIWEIVIIRSNYCKPKRFETLQRSNLLRHTCRAIHCWLFIQTASSQKHFSESFEHLSSPPFPFEQINDKKKRGIPLQIFIYMNQCKYSLDMKSQ